MLVIEMHEQKIPGRIDQDRIFKELAEMAGTDRYYKYGIEIPGDLVDFVANANKVAFTGEYTIIRYVKVRYAA